MGTSFHKLKTCGFPCNLNMKMLDNLKNYFSSTPKEQIEKDWEEVKELNEIDDGGTLEYML